MKGISVHVFVHFFYELHVLRGLFCVAATNRYSR